MASKRIPREWVEDGADAYAFAFVPWGEHPTMSDPGVFQLFDGRWKWFTENFEGTEETLQDAMDKAEEAFYDTQD